MCGGSEVGREGGGWGVNLLSRMAEGLHCPRGMASSLAVCRGNGPRVAALQVNESSTTSSVTSTSFLRLSVLLEFD